MKELLITFKSLMYDYFGVILENTAIPFYVLEGVIFGMSEEDPENNLAILTTCPKCNLTLKHKFANKNSLVRTLDTRIINNHCKNCDELFDQSIYCMDSSIKGKENNE